MPLVSPSNVCIRDGFSPDHSQQYVVPELLCEWALSKSKMRSRSRFGERWSLLLSTTGVRVCRCVVDAAHALRAGWCFPGVVGCDGCVGLCAFPHPSSPVSYSLSRFLPAPDSPSIHFSQPCACALPSFTVLDGIRDPGITGSVCLCVV